MAIIVYQGEEHAIPDGEMHGEELLRELDVPKDHNLIVLRPEGNQLVPRRGKVRPVDGDHFLDAPTFEYGGA